MNNELLFEVSEIVRQLLVKVRRQLQVSIQEHGLELSVQEAHLLIILQQPDINTPIQLATATGYDKAVVTRAIKQLLNLGMVTKSPSPSDKRSILLTLTTKGEKTFQTFYQARLAAHQEVFKPLSNKDLLQVKKLLAQCL